MKPKPSTFAGCNSETEASATYVCVWWWWGGGWRGRGEGSEEEEGRGAVSNKPYVKASPVGSHLLILPLSQFRVDNSLKVCLPPQIPLLCL
ncbi:hypothetical protein BHM03_00043811 [Ensete ventricosum]|uniref:Uncharacterized protein n=1 Tax=Ensete ventricosum TaxID=4639 RepID=A0A445ML00_ENSVE|nr:hypothetical protein BHM03_00043811 [Ensete ventricosum]